MQPLIDSFALIGLFTTSYALVSGCKLLHYYLKFKEFPKTIDEQRIVILQTENTRLFSKLDVLEDENKQITLMNGIKL